MIIVSPFGYCIVLFRPLNLKYSMKKTLRIILVRDTTLKLITEVRARFNLIYNMCASAFKIYEKTRGWEYL